jgi:proteasome lid subunit RPN8/RPN11
MPRLQSPPASHRFRLEFRQRGGKCFSEVPLDEADFARAIETAFFDGLRRGRFSRYEVPHEGVRLEPCFAKAIAPRTRGFRVILPTPTGDEHQVEFPTRFFSPRAQQLMRELLVAGRINADTLLFFHLAAYPDDPRPTPERTTGMILEPEAPTVPIRAGSRKALGRTELWDNPRAEDLPVLIPRRVLHEALTQARRTPDREVGGLLLGHLCRDDATRELFLQITGHVAADETEATEASVTFTTATWQRGREVVQQRGANEIFAGWVHSHPFLFTEPCPDPVPREWSSQVLFFSSDDHFLMELTFPRPFMIALQTAVEPRLEKALGHWPVRLYGWRDGAIVTRGFEVFDE